MEIITPAAVMLFGFLPPFVLINPPRIGYGARSRFRRINRSSPFHRAREVARWRDDGATGCEKDTAHVQTMLGGAGGIMQTKYKK